MKIKSGDTIKVLAGKDKGKTGKVLQVFPSLNRVSVEGINLNVKHLRSRQQGEKGQKIEYPAPIHISNVQLVDPKTGNPTRVGYTFVEEAGKKRKVRISKKTKELID